MTGDQQSERLDQDEDADNVERFRVLVGARLARLGVPMTVTTLDDDHEIEKRYDIDRLRVEVGYLSSDARYLRRTPPKSSMSLTTTSRIVATRMGGNSDDRARLGTPSDTH